MRTHAANHRSKAHGLALFSYPEQDFKELYRAMSCRRKSLRQRNRVTAVGKLHAKEERQLTSRFSISGDGEILPGLTGQDPNRPKRRMWPLFRLAHLPLTQCQSRLEIARAAAIRREDMRASSSAPFQRGRATAALIAPTSEPSDVMTGTAVAMSPRYSSFSVWA